jgi:hypothetical protein
VRQIEVRRPETDPCEHYRGWVQLGLVREFRRQGSTTVRRFGHDLIVSAESDRPITILGDARPVIEVGGVVFAYHRGADDDCDEPPPPLNAGLVTALERSGCLRSSWRTTMDAPLPLVVENGVDRGHFLAVHRNRVAAIGPYTHEVRSDGAFRADLVMTNQFKPIYRKDGRNELELVDACNGWNRNEPFGHWHQIIVMLAPLGDNRVEGLFVARSPRWIPIFDHMVHASIVVQSRMALADDNRVLSTRWNEHKAILSDADGPIMAFRRWHEGFRSPIDRAAGEHR